MSQRITDRDIICRSLLLMITRFDRNSGHQRTNLRQAKDSAIRSPENRSHGGPVGGASTRPASPVRTSRRGLHGSRRGEAGHRGFSKRAFTQGDLGMPSRDAAA